MLCRSVEFDLPNSQHMFGLIGPSRANVGRLNGYHCYCSSTRASTSFYNGINKLLSPALLKVSCLPVLPTVQPAAASSARPLILSAPASAGARARTNCRRSHARLLTPSCTCLRARAHSLHMRMHSTSYIWEFAPQRYP